MPPDILNEEPITSTIKGEFVVEVDPTVFKFNVPPEIFIFVTATKLGRSNLPDTLIVPPERVSNAPFEFNISSALSPTLTVPELQVNAP